MNFMKKIIGTLFLLFMVASIHAQILPPDPPPPSTDSTKKENVIHEEEAIYDIVEVMPEFPGGEKAMIQFLASKIKYPVMSKENGYQGTVYVEFIIDKTGQVKDVKIARGVNFELDREAIRVVKMMPRWQPGTQYDKPINVRYRLPINFKLD